MSARRTAGDRGCFRLALHDVGEIEPSGPIVGYRRELGRGKGRAAGAAPRPGPVPGRSLSRRSGIARSARVRCLTPCCGRIAA